MYFLEDVVGCYGIEPVVRLIKNGVLPILYVAIGIILVVLIIIDIAKAIVAGDEKEVKAAQKAAIRRLIYGVAIFFVVIIVNFAFRLLGNAQAEDIKESDYTNWYTCWENV